LFKVDEKGRRKTQMDQFFNKNFLIETRYNDGLLNETYNNYGELSIVRACAHFILSAECRLARGHPQWSGILDSFGQSEISGSTFWVDLEL
jgi:hypothetical protein